MLGLNDAPIGAPVDVATDEDTPFTFDLLDESGAFDLDGTGPIQLDSVDSVLLPLNNDDETITLGSGAVITASRDGVITYDPDDFFQSLRQGQTGTDGFTFDLTDGFGDVLSLVNLGFEKFEEAIAVVAHNLHQEIVAAGNPEDVDHV